MTWRIRMSEIDSSGHVIHSCVLAYRAASRANATAFKDNILNTMLAVSFRRPPQLDIFEEPDNPAPRQWAPQ
jgi:hypothetical protein